MRIAYIFFNDLAENTANVNQVLNMTHAFAQETETLFISSWIGNKKLKERLDFFAIAPQFKHIRLPARLILSSFLLEKISRLWYVILALIYIRFAKVDVLYTRDFGFVYFLSLLPQWLRPKQRLIYEPHTLFHLSSDKVKKEQEAAAVKVPDLFCPISKGIQEDMISIFGVNRQQIRVFPDAFNPITFEKVQVQDSYLGGKYPASTGKPIILYTGSFKSWKGVDVLIKAIRHCKNDAFFLLVGGVGNLKNQMEALAQSEGVTDRLYIDGFLSQDQVVAIQKSADIAIIPNNRATIGERYTSPLKVFEYLAAGLPIIASDLPALREILTSEENALFFEPENEIALAQVIDQLLSDTTLRQRMAAHNLHKSADFSWNQRAKGIIEFIS